MTTPRISAKGRAIAARPFVLLALTGLFVLALASSAQAALPVPTLTGTNPASPNSSTTPRVKGKIEESETKVVTFGVNRLRPITQADEPNNTVRLYTKSDCTGPEAGVGTVELLEGQGIQVGAVATEAVTTFYATQENGIEISGCSTGLRYRQVTDAPDAPVFTAVTPASPANNNFPHLIGTADPEATVSIYANADCSGSPVASGSGAQFGAEGIETAVADNSESTFSALAEIAGFESGCSAATIAYREETPPPSPDPGPGSGNGGGGGNPASPPAPPRIHTEPAGWANDNTPLIAGTAAGAGSVRIYADANCGGSPVGKGSAAELAAGIPVRVVDNAAVLFSAVSVAGDKTSKCSDPVVYVEDSLTPRTRITMAPGAKTAKRKATIRFTDTTATLPGTSFLCKVDKAKWKKCSSPLRLKKLKLKKYTVRVKASDPAGNVETKGAKRSFKVIARP